MRGFEKKTDRDGIFSKPHIGMICTIVTKVHIAIRSNIGPELFMAQKYALKIWAESDHYTFRKH